MKENERGLMTFGWRFPAAPIPKIATCASVRRALPHYVTYPEFVALVEGEIKPSRIPERADALRVCKTITAELSDKRLTDGDVRAVSKAFAAAYKILGIEE